jgi:hypothetical protein
MVFTKLSEVLVCLTKAIRKTLDMSRSRRVISCTRTFMELLRSNRRITLLRANNLVSRNSFVTKYANC